MNSVRPWIRPKMMAWMMDIR